MTDFRDIPLGGHRIFADRGLRVEDLIRAQRLATSGPACGKCGAHKTDPQVSEWYETSVPGYPPLCGDCYRAKQSPERRTDWVARVLEATPPAERDRVYKALARAYHPDVAGGSTEIMQRLNTEKERLK